MIAFPNTILGILARGGSVRVPFKGMMPNTAMQYAQAAFAGGGHVEFVLDGALALPEVLNDVSQAGAGHVWWDFVSKVE